MVASSSHLGDGSEAGEGGAREAAGAPSDLWTALSFGRGADGRGGWRAALSQLMRRGNDVEAAAVNHRVRQGAWRRLGAVCAPLMGAHPAHEPLP